MPKTRREACEAWAVCREGDGEVRAIEPTKDMAERSGRSDAGAGKFEVVRLVEHNPAADAVVRAALELHRRSTEYRNGYPVEQWGPMVRARNKLARAVVRFEKRKVL